MTSLARITPQSLLIEEHWDIELVRSNNDQYRFVSPPGVRVVTEIAMDGGALASPDGLRDVFAGGGKARVGVYGFYWAGSTPGDGVGIDDVLLTSRASRPPLVVDDHPRWRAWAVDVDLGGEAPLDPDATGLDHLVLTNEDEIPLHNSGVFPIDLEARVAADDDARSESGASRSPRPGEIDVIRSQRSEFDLILTFVVKFPRSSAIGETRATLSRCRLKWPIADADDVQLTYGKEEQVGHAVGYAPESGMIEFGGFEASAPSGATEIRFRPVHLSVTSPEILRDMPPLLGEAEVLIEGLLSGLVPFVGDWRGHVVGGAASTDQSPRPDVRVRTRIRVGLQLSLRDLYRKRSYTTAYRLQLAGVNVSGQRLDYIGSILREERFETEKPEPIDGPDDKRQQWLFAARRRQGGGDWLYVALLVTTLTRDVLVDSGTESTRVQRHDRGADTTIDICGVLPTHPREVGIAINELQRRLRERLLHFSGIL